MSVVRHQHVPSPSTSVKENREKPTTSNCDHTKSEIMKTHPFISDSKNLSNPQFISKWANEFLPKPEPPRFFRPLCNRLARQNQILQELEQRHHDNTKKIIGEARRRMEMSIRQTRDEQKAQLKEKRKVDKNVKSSSSPTLKKMSTSDTRQNSKRSSSQMNSGRVDIKKSRKDLMLATKNGITAKDQLNKVC